MHIIISLTYVYCSSNSIRTLDRLLLPPYLDLFLLTFVLYIWVSAWVIPIYFSKHRINNLCGTLFPTPVNFNFITLQHFLHHRNSFACHSLRFKFPFQLMQYMLGISLRLMGMGKKIPTFQALARRALSPKPNALLSWLWSRYWTLCIAETFAISLSLSLFCFHYWAPIELPEILCFFSRVNSNDCLLIHFIEWNCGSEGNLKKVFLTYKLEDG